MIDPFTTTLAHDRQHELRQQAEIDRLVREARLADTPQPRQRVSRRFPAVFSRLFAIRASHQLAGETETVHDDKPTAA